MMDALADLPPMVIADLLGHPPQDCRTLGHARRRELVRILVVADVTGPGEDRSGQLYERYEDMARLSPVVRHPINMLGRYSLSSFPTCLEASIPDASSLIAADRRCGGPVPDVTMRGGAGWSSRRSVGGAACEHRTAVRLAMRARR